MKRFIFILFFVFNSNAFNIFEDVLDNLDYRLATRSKNFYQGTCGYDPNQNSKKSLEEIKNYNITRFAHHPFFEGLFVQGKVEEDFYNGQISFELSGMCTYYSNVFWQHCIERMKYDLETSECQENIDVIILDKLEKAISFASTFSIKKE